MRNDSTEVTREDMEQIYRNLHKSREQMAKEEEEKWRKYKKRNSHVRKSG